MRRRDRVGVKGQVDPDDTYPPVVIGQVVFNGARRGVVCRPWSSRPLWASPRPGVQGIDPACRWFNVIFFDDYEECGYFTGEKIYSKPSDWRVTDEFVSQEIVDELIAGSDTQEAEKRAAEEHRQEAVKQKWGGDELQLIAELRAQYHWAIPEEAESNAHKRAVKNLRLELPRAFPDIRFSVNSTYNSVRIAWYSGPSRVEVEAVTAKYQNPYSDSRDQVDHDIYESSPYGGAIKTVFGRIEHLIYERDNRTKEEAEEWMRQYLDEAIRERRNHLAKLDPDNQKVMARLQKSIEWYERKKAKMDRQSTIKTRGAAR
jgi:Large polyvalent protein associated domain 29